MTPDPWARLRAALDSWTAPRGYALRYACDERAGRLALSLVADCGACEAFNISRIDSAEGVDLLAECLPGALDRAAHGLLREHMFCKGRLPRAFRRAGRHFEGWADDYAFLHRYRARGEQHQC